MFAHVQILQLMARKLRHQKNMRAHLTTRCTVHLHGGETERFLGEIIIVWESARSWRGVSSPSRVVLSEAVDWCICYIRKILHGGDSERSQPQGPKNVHNFATSELSMRAWNWNVTDSKKAIFDLIIPRYIQIWHSKEMSHDFVRGQSVAETCFSHWD